MASYVLIMIYVIKRAILLLKMCHNIHKLLATGDQVLSTSPLHVKVQRLPVGPSEGEGYCLTDYAYRRHQIQSPTSPVKEPQIRGTDKG